MGRTLVALAILAAALLGGDLYHPSAVYSLWLPLLGAAAFAYLMWRLLAGRGRDGGAGDGGNA